jgi:hypothetical protein
MTIVLNMYGRKEVPIIQSISKEIPDDTAQFLHLHFEHDDIGRLRNGERQPAERSEIGHERG